MMEEKTATNKAEPEPEIKRFNVKKTLLYLLLGLLAASFGFLHYAYVSHLFENDRNFSYLSEMEREMSFKTEMGFYYSYYKTIVEEKPFIAGITKLLYDRLVEFPNEVNALNRFNIAPEVMIGAVYRYLEPWLNSTAHRSCHLVSRGEELGPVQSCLGFGEPVIFYLEAVWLMAGLLVAVVFLGAYNLSNSILGGILAVVQYFANHAESTRVQWAPNERENFAAPLLFLQLCLVGRQLRGRGRCSCGLQVSLFIVNCLCLLFWQFTQFIFLTQTAIFFVMEQFRIIDLKSLCVFLHSHFCGLHMAVLFFQGNDMLKSSLYTSFFLAVSAYCLFFSTFRIKVQNRLDLFIETWLIVLRVSIVMTGSIYLKYLISDFLQVDNDSHVWHILYSKFSDFKTFHTLLYTCSEVFDFLPLSSVKNMTKTLLIPVVVLNVINTSFTWFSNAVDKTQNELKKEAEHLEEDSDSGIENNADSKMRNRNTDLDVLEEDASRTRRDDGDVDVLLCFFKHLNIEPVVFYNVSQLVVFGVMAALVMRLKLLFATQMCVMSSLFLSTDNFVFPKFAKKYLLIFWMLFTVFFAYELQKNLHQEMANIGEFSDWPMEQLMTWIMRETGPRAAFAGSMPLLASILLVTRRPIVAHPHYETRHARERAYSIYKVYGRFPPEELYRELTRLQAMYLVVENKYCYGQSSRGCSFDDIWSSLGATRGGRACHALLTRAQDHFYPVFRNDHYAVFRLHDYSVRYMPRSFDT